jgi:prolyl oligopeptidase
VHKILISALLFSGAVHAQATDLNFDKVAYEWLETIESPAVNTFVEKRNALSLERLEQTPGFKKIQNFIQKDIQESQEFNKQKGAIRGAYAYNFYRDDKNPKGVYRKIAKETYLLAKKTGDFKKLRWEIIVDLDKFIASHKFPAEIKSPSLGSWTCYNDEITKEPLRCLIGFSENGGDRTIFYEFDLKKKQWLQTQGFNFEFLSRSSASWVDENTLLLNLDGFSYHNILHPESPITQERAIELGFITKTGYPNKTYLWKRGVPFSEASLIYKAPPQVASAAVSGTLKWNKGDNAGKVLFIYESENSKDYKVTIRHDIDSDGTYQDLKLDLPLKISIFGLTDSHEYVFKTNSDWKEFKSDDIISIQLNLEKGVLSTSTPKLIYRNTNTDLIVQSGYVSTGEEYDPADDQIYLSLKRNVSSEILLFSRSGNGWTSENFKDPLNLKHKSMSLWQDDDDKTLHLSVVSFLVPSTEYIVHKKNNTVTYEEVDRDLKKFNSEKFKTEQLWVDQGLDQNGKAIKVPYFIVYDPSKVSLQNNKTPAPTLIWAYGGFGIGYGPSYLGRTGSVWLEKGGVYVLANIRGGNEFGTYWHESAKKENRVNSYNDLFAISEDLIARGITTPQKLAIQGGSNGGLLVGVAATQRPDLYGAVVCEVPLLDMSRYNKLLVGASWMDEYGDPQGAEKPFWKKYSPLHQLKAGVEYPRMFIKTNRHDDRVHPAHARKFSARLEELGVDHFYFEDTRGGHGGTSLTSEESAYRSALTVIYLYSQLGMIN